MPSGGDEERQRHVRAHRFEGELHALADPDRPFVDAPEGRVDAHAGIHVDGGDARYGVSAIAGVPIGSGSLAYGRVGYAWHDGLPADVGKGMVFGGGFETRLTGPVNVRLDYKYLDLGETNVPDNMLSYTGHEVTAGFVVGF